MRSPIPYTNSLVNVLRPLVTTLEIMNVYRPETLRLRSQARNPKAVEAFNTLKKSLQREWYKTLKALREWQPPNTIEGLGRKAQLETTWVDFGAVVGLDEKQEKQDYEHRLKQTCAWRDCEYHDDKPPNGTRACAGCGEVAYCSRACQTR